MSVLLGVLSGAAATAARLDVTDIGRSSGAKHRLPIGNWKTYANKGKTMSEQYTEYAVLVPDRGYLTQYDTVDVVADANADEAKWHRNTADAYWCRDNLKLQLRRMGCVDVADSVQIMVRTVTVERTEPRPLSETRDFAGETVKAF